MATVAFINRLQPAAGKRDVLIGLAARTGVLLPSAHHVVEQHT